MWRGWHRGLASRCYRCFISLWSSSVKIHLFTPKSPWRACDCRQGKPPVTTSSRCSAAGHRKRPGSLSALGRRSNLLDLENKHDWKHWRVGTETGSLGIFYHLPGYEGSDLRDFLKEIEASELVLMDRWSIQVIPHDPQEAGDPVPYEIINNYFSIGVVSLIFFFFPDQIQSWTYFNFTGFRLSRTPRSLVASIPWGRDTPRDSTAGERSAYQDRFSPLTALWNNPFPSCHFRVKNKLWYFEFATSETIFASCKKLKDCLVIEVRS